ncbi:hypothetical protein KQX54_015398 [Cotesia glomerata]|uniref:Uncharacterized protein n=1 Tax=Cotesia glomerata TaxID=32391 RepID=A0AAV7IK32_COTGL|nr:hypothetical protein KQX54_015398 [Cotesia glomerata]
MGHSTPEWRGWTMTRPMCSVTRAPSRRQPHLCDVGYTFASHSAPIQIQSSVCGTGRRLLPPIMRHQVDEASDEDDDSKVCGWYLAISSFAYALWLDHLSLRSKNRVKSCTRQRRKE